MGVILQTQKKNTDIQKEDTLCLKKFQPYFNRGRASMAATLHRKGNHRLIRSTAHLLKPLKTNLSDSERSTSKQPRAADTRLFTERDLTQTADI